MLNRAKLIGASLSRFAVKYVVSVAAVTMLLGVSISPTEAATRAAVAQVTCYGNGNSVITDANVRGTIHLAARDVTFRLTCRSNDNSGLSREALPSTITTADGQVTGMDVWSVVGLSSGGYRPEGYVHIGSGYFTIDYCADDDNAKGCMHVLITIDNP